MKLFISENMDDYREQQIELKDPGLTNARRVQARAFDKLGLNPASRRPERCSFRWARMAAVAAAVVLCLSAAAFAAYQNGLFDRVMAQDGGQNEAGQSMAHYSMVEPMAEAETVTGSHDMGLSTGGNSSALSVARADRSESLAQQEWFEYFWAIPEEDYDEALPQDDFWKRNYGIGWKAVAEKLEGIIEAYGLQPRTLQGTYDSLDAFYGATGLEGFLSLSDGNGNISFSVSSVYEDGSFDLDAVSMSMEDGQSLSLSVYRAMKGSFSERYLQGGVPESYDYEIYTTADGTTVELALGEWYSFIFAELDNSYVAVKANGGKAPTEYLALLDMDDLKYIADGMDFDLLQTQGVPEA